MRFMEGQCMFYSNTMYQIAAALVQVILISQRWQNKNMT